MIPNDFISTKGPVVIRNVNTKFKDTEFSSPMSISEKGKIKCIFKIEPKLIYNTVNLLLYMVVGTLMCPYPLPPPSSLW